MAGQGFNPINMGNASELYNNFKMRAGPPNLYQIPDQKDSPASKFPQMQGSTNPQDDMRGLQAQMVDPKTGIVPGVGLSVLDSGYWQYTQEKRQEAMLFEFNNYILSQADLSTPESAAWWFNAFPEIRDLKFQEIDRQAEIQKDLAKIAITGPQSRKDFEILFLKQNNLLGDRDVPLYRLNEADLGYAKDFKSGMFSVFSKKQNTILTPQKNKGNSSGIAPDTNDLGNEGWVFPWNNPVGGLADATPAIGPISGLGGNKLEFKNMMKFGS